MATYNLDPTMSALASKGSAVQEATNAAVAAKGGRPQPATQPTTQPANTGFTYNSDQLAAIYKHNPARAQQLGYVAPPADVEIGAGELGTAGMGVATEPAAASPLDSQLSAAIGGEQAVAEPQELSARDMAVQNLMGVYQEGQDFDADAIRRQEGVFARQEEANRLQQGYDQAVADQRRTIQEMRTNPEGKLRGALEADIQNYKYESDQNLADKAMALHYARQDYQMAYETAQSAIDAENQRYERQMGFWRTMYDVLGDDMTDSEQATFNSQLRLQEQFVSDMRETKMEAVRVASVNGAPVDVVQNIKNASTPEEAWVAAGQYGIDPNLSWQKSRFAAEQQLAWAKYNLDAAAKAGDISAETAQREVAKKQNDAVYANMQENIVEAYNNELGLSVTTGKIKGAFVSAFQPSNRGYFANKLAQENLASNMDYITSVSTLNALADAKARGITFGALNEKEMDVVADSANKLATMWDREKQEFIGSPEKVEKALKDLYETVSESRVDNAVGIATSNQMDEVWNQI